MATITNETIQPHIQADAGAEYAFSSSSFRKKKRGKKKVRGKTFITKEEALSRRDRPNQELSRSHSVPALLSNRKTHETPKTNHQWDNSASKASPVVVKNPAVVTPPSSVGIPAVDPSSGSPIGNNHNASRPKRQDQQDYELDLSSSARLRDIRKPWEMDIQTKNKTEYGDNLLRDGPSSASRVTTNRAASHHKNFRRSRSLSTTRHRSLSRSRHTHHTSHRFFSEKHSSGSEDNPCSDDEIDKQDFADGRCSFDDEDQTYEKYRQFLASSKSNDNDENLSRQSVKSLKQKVGAAPAIEFSYRYTAAADELLGLGNGGYDDYDNTTSYEESKSNTEEKAYPLELENLAERNENSGETADQTVFLDNVAQDVDASNDQTPFLGDVALDVDASNDIDIDIDIGQSRCKEHGSSSVVEQDASIPLSSPHPPSLPCSISPTLYSPTIIALAEEELPSLPIRQTLQQEEDENEKKNPDLLLLSKEIPPHSEKERSLSFESESDKVDEDRDIPSSEEEDRYGYEDKIGDPISYIQQTLQQEEDEDEKEAPDPLLLSKEIPPHSEKESESDKVDEDRDIPSSEEEEDRNGYEDEIGDPISYIQQTLQQEEDEDEKETPDPLLLSNEIPPHSEKESESDKVDVDRDIPSSEEEEEEDRNDYEDGIDDPIIGSSQQQEDVKKCPDDIELRPSGNDEVHVQENASCSDVDHHEFSDDESNGLFEVRHCEPTVSPTLVRSSAPSFVLDENDQIQDLDGKDDGSHGSVSYSDTNHYQCSDDEGDGFSEVRHCEPGASPTLVQSRASDLGSDESSLEENETSQGCVGEEDRSHGNVVEESSKASTKIHIDNDIDEEGGEDSSFEDMEEDPDYPEEDREFLALLFDIHMR